MGIGMYGVFGAAPPVSMLIWVVTVGFLFVGAIHRIAVYQGHKRRVRQWQSWTPSAYWHASASDQRFTPVGDRERMAYASGLRDSIRIINDLRWSADKPGWSDGNCFLKDAQKKLHERAIFIEKHACPHGFTDWDNCGECCH